MTDEMHPYQKKAVAHILEKPRSVLMLEMGLGKTRVVLEAVKVLYEKGEVKRVLVIAPKRVALTVWRQESEKWRMPYNVAIAVGSEKERTEAVLSGACITVINRENVVWLRTKHPEHCREYDTVILDELSSFKNHGAKRFKAFVSFHHLAKRIWGLTGTPISRGYVDLWGQYFCIDGGIRLEKYITHFRDMYLLPDKTNGAVVYSWKLQHGAQKRIDDKVADITLSMKAIDHLEMPVLAKVNRYIELDKEKEAYKALKKDNVYLDIEAPNGGVLAGKLVQVAGGAVYKDDGITSVQVGTSKIDALLDTLEEANGNPTLVAYWYKHEYERITKALDTAGIDYVTINTPESIEVWKRGETTVGLIHPASAGHGLNIQDGGHLIVWYTLPWSYELYAQTNARLWRQGQKSSAVTVTHLIAKGTIDERILETLERGQDFTADLMEATK